ncbi:MAG: Reeler domain-containing protein [Xanthomonadales bacterium]|nr:Reeler domain-containing protein [Xanthomonadales bacterium]
MNNRTRNPPGEGPYSVSLDTLSETYTPGAEHGVTIASADESVFNGLLIYAETMLGERVGRFDKSDEFVGSPTVGCPGDPDATASHAFAGPLSATTLTIPWTAPDQDVGPIVFRSIVLGGSRGDIASQAFYFPEEPALTAAGEEAGFEINRGISGAWFDAATPGQGFLIDVAPDSEFIFVAWFTFDAAAAKVGAPAQRWLTAQGNYLGETAELVLSNTSGGAFDDPQTTTTVPAGTLNLNFDSCTGGTIEYAIDDGELAGSMPIERVIPGTEALCETLTESAE